MGGGGVTHPSPGKSHGTRVHQVPCGSIPQAHRAAAPRAQSLIQYSYQKHTVPGMPLATHTHPRRVASATGSRRLHSLSKRQQVHPNFGGRFLFGCAARHATGPLCKTRGMGWGRSVFKPLVTSPEGPFLSQHAPRPQGHCRPRATQAQ